MYVIQHWQIILAIRGQRNGAKEMQSKTYMYSRDITLATDEGLVDHALLVGFSGDRVEFADDVGAPGALQITPALTNYSSDSRSKKLHQRNAVNETSYATCNDKPN